MKDPVFSGNSVFTDSIDGLSSEEYGLDRIVGISRIITELKEKLLEYASHDASVLLLGESGTGKDLAARCIHELSGRRPYPFIALNCGAIPPELMEAELFGVEKGAFTGAFSHPGKFELCHRGTIFLDEIGELPLGAQVKLLRVLENKSLCRLGGSSETSLDFRIISATNSDLREGIKKKGFRLDLFFRINTLVLELPPLRKRQEDIRILANFFLKKIDPSRKKQLSPNAVEKLYSHNWPGNIRELKNVIERAVYNSRSEVIRAGDIDFFIL